MIVVWYGIVDTTWNKSEVYEILPFCNQNAKPKIFPNKNGIEFKAYRTLLCEIMSKVYQIKSNSITTTFISFWIELTCFILKK